LLRPVWPPPVFSEARGDDGRSHSSRKDTTMSVVINTNASATVASNNLASSNAMLQRSLNRLSSGSKIVTPSDDAGGLAVSMKLSAAAKRQGAVASNIGNSVSYLQTQDGALKVTAKVLDRMSELKTLYADPTKNSSDLANYDSEFTALQSQLTSLVSEKFNGVTLFGSAYAPGLNVIVTEDGSTASRLPSATASSPAARPVSVPSPALRSPASVPPASPCPPSRPRFKTWPRCARRTVLNKAALASRASCSRPTRPTSKPPIAASSMWTWRRNPPSSHVGIPSCRPVLRCLPRPTVRRRRPSVCCRNVSVSVDSRLIRILPLPRAYSSTRGVFIFKLERR
jgi:hypothetical protein